MRTTSRLTVGNSRYATTSTPVRYLPQCGLRRPVALSTAPAMNMLYNGITSSATAAMTGDAAASQNLCRVQRRGRRERMNESAKTLG